MQTKTPENSAEKPPSHPAFAGVWEDACSLLPGGHPS